MGNVLKQFFFPKMDPEVQSAIDQENLSYIRHTSFVVFLFEALSLVIFLLTRKEFDHKVFVSITSVSFCLFACLLGILVSNALRKKENASHVAVSAFKICYYLLLTIWALQVSYRNYRSQEEFLTFFAVQIILVCLIPLTPVQSILFSCLTYISLYLICLSIDGAKGINIFNYAALLIVTIIGMITRFHQQSRSFQKTVELRNTNDQLEYAGRHDSLTGLRNRLALEEDVEKIVNNHLTAYMIDINYFKEINDTYGHVVGDAVLKHTADWIRSVFDGCRCYRYGGDEFLVLSENGTPYKEDTYPFTVPEIPDDSLLLSIGTAEGDPTNHDELFTLIVNADRALYVVKKRTHSPEFGGHGERPLRI